VQTLREKINVQFFLQSSRMRTYMTASQQLWYRPKQSKDKKHDIYILYSLTMAVSNCDLCYINNCAQTQRGDEAILLQFCRLSLH